MSDTVAKARAMLAAATPGPWEAREHDGLRAISHPGGWVLDGALCEDDEAADAALIAAAPTLLAALADEVERVRAKHAADWQKEMLHQRKRYAEACARATKAEAERDRLRAKIADAEAVLDEMADEMADVEYELGQVLDDWIARMMDALGIQTAALDAATGKEAGIDREAEARAEASHLRERAAYDEGRRAGAEEMRVERDRLRAVVDVAHRIAPDSHEPDWLRLYAALDALTPTDDDAATGEEAGT